MTLPCQVFLFMVVYLPDYFYALCVLCADDVQPVLCLFQFFKITTLKSSQCHSRIKSFHVHLCFGSTFVSFTKSGLPKSTLATFSKYSD